MSFVRLAFIAVVKLRVLIVLPPTSLLRPFQDYVELQQDEQSGLFTNPPAADFNEIKGQFTNQNQTAEQNAANLHDAHLAVFATAWA